MSKQPLTTEEQELLDKLHDDGPLTAAQLDEWRPGAASMVRDLSNRGRVAAGGDGVPTLYYTPAHFMRVMAGGN